MRERFLTVPKNSKGIEEYNAGVQEGENLHSFSLPDKEFSLLLPVFSTMNKDLGLLIDDYESETIRNEQLRKCKNIVDKKAIDCPVFYQALNKAIENNTIVALDF